MGARSGSGCGWWTRVGRGRGRGQAEAISRAAARGAAGVDWGAVCRRGLLVQAVRVGARKALCQGGWGWRMEVRDGGGRGSSQVGVKPGGQCVVGAVAGSAPSGQS